MYVCMYVCMYVYICIRPQFFLIMWITDFGAFRQQSEEEITLKINLRISLFLKIDKDIDRRGKKLKA